MLAAGTCGAEDQAALQERMHRAAELTSLDWPGLKPWHMKLSVEVFGGDGKSKGQGTIEEWWASATLNRVVYATPVYKGTALRTADGLFRSAGLGPEDADMETMLRQVVHPMPTVSELEQGTLILRTEDMAKVKLECVMLGQPIRGVGILPLGLFPTYCLDPGGVSLRLTYEFGGQYTVRNRLGSFLGRTVPMEESVSSNEKVLGKASIVTLETAALTAADFIPGADLKKVGEVPSAVPSDVMARRASTQPIPVFPQEAKQNRISGQVVLRARIGTDGHVRSLTPITYKDGVLVVSAIAAVRQWTYSPYLVNGEPTEVDTTITVNYDIH